MKFLMYSRPAWKQNVGIAGNIAACTSKRCAVSSSSPFQLTCASAGFPSSWRADPFPNLETDLKDIKEPIRNDRALYQALQSPSSIVRFAESWCPVGLPVPKFTQIFRWHCNYLAIQIDIKIGNQSDQLGVR